MSTHPSQIPTPDPEDAWLEKLLRQPADKAHSHDDGAAFTERVLTALPPPANVTRRAERGRRLLLISAAAVLGCGVAWMCGGAGLAESALEFARLTTHTVGQLDSPNAVAVQALAVVSAIAMLWFAGPRTLRRLF